MSVAVVNLRTALDSDHRSDSPDSQKRNNHAEYHIIGKTCAAAPAQLTVAHAVADCAQ